MREQTFWVRTGLIAAALLVLNAGTGMAAQQKQEGASSKDTLSQEAKKEDISKVEKKKKMHKERKAAAARFKEAQGAGKK